MYGDKPDKIVQIVPPVKKLQEEIKQEYHQKRVIAYCRVSTKQEEQLNSYETQRATYVEMINKNPDWKLVKIFADKGITGTSVKNRDEFNKMIKLCQQGKADMIITKSISRFARNTLDCLHYTRLLKQYGVDVYFEEQKIHSMQPGAEFYITIYGCIAQSESENISANVKWGKEQSAKQGKVSFHYKNFLGYKKGEDGKPVIDLEQAAVIKFIYDRFLCGDSLNEIAKKLMELKIPSPGGKEKWRCTTIHSILTNERYKGDAIINKTYVTDCLTKKVRVNKGERVKYYVKNNHPAIIDATVFDDVQRELARRSCKPKVKQVGTKTALGKYSGKYALTDLLLCGECKTPYRRCTWTVKGKKKIVWRCINRLDYGKKYCQNSPTIEETALHEGIMAAILCIAQKNTDVLQTLKEHIRMGLDSVQNDDAGIADTERRINEINVAFREIIERTSADTLADFDEELMQQLINEKQKLEIELNNKQEYQEQQEKVKCRIDKISSILEGIKNHPIPYDDIIVRQLLECVVVESKNEIKVVFKGGLEVQQSLPQEKGDFLDKLEPLRMNS